MYEYKVDSVVDVIDGDTIDVVISLGFDVYVKKRIRLAGIDTPESRTKDPYEKRLGLESKAWLKNVLAGAQKIVIRTEQINSVGKFGRTLGEIFLDNSEKSVNVMMIEQGYAWEYHGEAKIKDFELLKSRRDGA